MESKGKLVGAAMEAIEGLTTEDREAVILASVFRVAQKVFDSAVLSRPVQNHQVFEGTH